jgi:hypothetical protein
VIYLDRSHDICFDSRHILEDCFQLYSEIEQIPVRGYLVDERQKVEAIKAIFLPRAEHFSPGEPGTWLGFDSEEVQVVVLRIIAKSTVSSYLTSAPAAFGCPVSR